MFAMKFQAKALQPIGLETSDFIGATDFVSKLKQERSDSTHAASGDANEMNPVPFLRENFLQVGLRCVRHGRIECTFPLPLPRDRRRLSEPATGNCRTCGAFYSRPPLIPG